MSNSSTIVDVEVRLVVYKVGDEYFATRTFPPQTDHTREEDRIFVLQEEIDAGNMEAFEQKARDEARRLNIPFVINLDKR